MRTQQLMGLFASSPSCLFWGDWDRRWITGSRRRDSYSSTARRCSRARFSPRACSDASCCSDATWRRCSSTSGEFVWWPAASWTTQQTSDAPSYPNPRQSGSHGSKRRQKTSRPTTPQEVSLGLNKCDFFCLVFVSWSFVCFSECSSCNDLLLCLVFFGHDQI